MHSVISFHLFIHSFIHTSPLCFSLCIPCIPFRVIPSIPGIPLVQVFTPVCLFIELNPYFQVLLFVCDVPGTGIKLDYCRGCILGL